MEPLFVLFGCFVSFFINGPLSCTGIQRCSTPAGEAEAGQGWRATRQGIASWTLMGKDERASALWVGASIVPDRFSHALKTHQEEMSPRTASLVSPRAGKSSFLLGIAK